MDSKRPHDDWDRTSELIRPCSANVDEVRQALELMGGHVALKLSAKPNSPKLNGASRARHQFQNPF